MGSTKYAILGDIHANIEALTAVLKDARGRGANDFICVGDIVGYNANPAECLDVVRDLKCLCVRGNHDHYCSHDESLDDFHPLAANVVDWTRGQLSETQLEFLRAQPLVRLFRGVTIVHSTLDMPEKWGYVFDTLEAESHFSYQATALCFYGHTHVPVMYEKTNRVQKRLLDTLRIEIGKKYFINTGSVGQPRDGDSRSAYVTYDQSARVVELHRVPYDLAAAQKKIRAAGLPERLARRLQLGR